MSAPPEIVIDFPVDSPVPAMRLAGMSLLERHVREARRAGAERIVVRATPAPWIADLASSLDFVNRAPGDAVDGRAEVVPGDQLLGVPITDERSRRRAEWDLLQTCRRPYDGPGDKFFIRTFSLRITRALSKTAITPTQVTFLNAAVGLVACVFAALGGYQGLALGGVGFIASVVLDSVDGELARVRHLTSRFGMIVDNVSDDVIDNGFVFAIGIGLGGPWFWVGLAAACARWLVAIRTYYEVHQAGKPGDVMAFRWWFESGEDTAEVYADYTSALTWIRSIGRRDSYCLLFGALCLANLGLPALFLGCIICGGYFAMLLLHVVMSSPRLGPR